MVMNNKVYDILKFIAQIVLPAIATFYITIAGIWGLPYGEEVSATVMAIDTLLGALLMLSSNAYAKQTSSDDNSNSDKEEN